MEDEKIIALFFQRSEQAIQALDEQESAFFSHYDPATVEFLTSFGR